MVSLHHRGSFKNTRKFFQKSVDTGAKLEKILHRYGPLGVRALMEATPTATGKTASSWGYEVVSNEGSMSLVWTNSNVVSGVPVAILIQYGHGTRSGTYVQGIDYINPALKPIFDRMAKEALLEVSL